MTDTLAENSDPMREDSTADALDPDVQKGLQDLADRNRFNGYIMALTDVLAAVDERVSKRVNRYVTNRELVDITDALVAAALKHSDGEDGVYRLPAR